MISLGNYKNGNESIDDRNPGVHSKTASKPKEHTVTSTNKMSRRLCEISNRLGT